jgi:hypothetical protein
VDFLIDPKIQTLEISQHIATAPHSISLPHLKLPPGKPNAHNPTSPTMAPSAITPPAVEVKSLKVPRPSMQRVDTSNMSTKRKIICFSDFDGTIFMQEYALIPPSIYPLPFSHATAPATFFLTTSAVAMTGAKFSTSRSTLGNAHFVM